MSGSVVGIVGCRKFDDYDLFKQKIIEWINKNGPIDKIVSGGATGADSLAERYAKDNSIEGEIVKAADMIDCLIYSIKEVNTGNKNMIMMKNKSWELLNKKFKKFKFVKLLLKETEGEYEWKE